MLRQSERSVQYIVQYICKSVLCYVRVNAPSNILYGTYVNLFYALAEWTVPPFLNYGDHDSVKYTYRPVLQSERSFQYFLLSIDNSVLCSGLLLATINIFNLQFTICSRHAITIFSCPFQYIYYITDRARLAPGWGGQPGIATRP